MRKKQLGVICIKVVIEWKGGDESAERGSVERIVSMRERIVYAVGKAQYHDQRSQKLHSSPENGQ